MPKPETTKPLSPLKWVRENYPEDNWMVGNDWILQFMKKYGDYRAKFERKQNG